MNYSLGGTKAGSLRVDSNRRVKLGIHSKVFRPPKGGAVLQHHLWGTQIGRLPIFHTVN